MNAEKVTHQENLPGKNEDDEGLGSTSLKAIKPDFLPGMENEND
jgi:hypothetical protein